MEAFVHLNKEIFEPNEDIKIKIKIDNSNCSKDLENCKANLIREFTIFKVKGQKGPLVQKTKKIANIEEKVDVKRKTKREYVLTLKIPKFDSLNLESSFGLNPTVLPLLKTLSASTSCSLFCLNYRLEVYIKHKSLTEFGPGNLVTFPISIQLANPP